MEPEALKFIEDCNAVQRGGGEMDTRTTDSASVMSIAISLRRIADEVCGVPYNNEPGADNSRHSTGLVAGIMLAIEQGLLAASQRG